VEAGGAEGLVARLGFHVHSLRGGNYGRGSMTAGGKQISGLGWMATGGTARSHAVCGRRRGNLYYVWCVGDRCEILGWPCMFLKRGASLVALESKCIHRLVSR
jgi:hypothetical protein